MMKIGTLQLDGAEFLVDDQVKSNPRNESGSGANLVKSILLDPEEKHNIW